MPADATAFLAVADAELTMAKPLSDNAFKIDLARRTMVAVLLDLAGDRP
jgi:xanthine dehydrogenase YagS FAD-binding subunit